MSPPAEKAAPAPLRGRHLVCERDVGLFSLIQQVVAQLPWALGAGRTPIVLFGGRCAYWVPGGYRDRTSVWEYYFEPLDPRHPADSVPAPVRAALAAHPPDPREVGHWLDDETWVSSHFGDHPRLAGRSLAIPHGWRDPGKALRQRAAALIREHVRPRDYVLDAVERFFCERMAGHEMVGVHIRGTDAVSEREQRPHRKDSLVLAHYRHALDALLARVPAARLLVATDDQRSLDFMREVYGERVLSYGRIRHRDGEAAGRGPTGALMPAYVTRDPELAARNGEEAVIEHLLLGRCRALVHNGSSLARTVLLANPDLPHLNANRKNRLLAELQTLSARRIRRGTRRAVQRASAVLRRRPVDV